MNSKILAISIVTALVAFSAISVNFAHADILPPKLQSKLGVPNDLILCETGMFKVLREGTNSVACIKAHNVSKLVAKGWAQPVDEDKLNKLIDSLKVSSGKIIELEVAPLKSDFGKQVGKTSIAGYDYVFDVCASSEDLVSPEVLVTSDSESINYELAETIPANSCITSATMIKAANPDSINAQLVSKGDIARLIISTQDKVNTLKDDLLKAKQSLGKDKPEENQKQGNKIADLRKQLNDARAELNRYYFFLYSPSKVTLPVEKMSYSGTPIPGQTATIISIKESVATKGTYDVVFEACAGEKQVRIPIITLSSDKQTVDVRLGDKIAPNTCQLTSAKIMATIQDSITIKVTGNSEFSNKAQDLEAKIADLQIQLKITKEKMKDLIHNPDRPNDFNEQLAKLVENTTKLRSEIISNKAELSKILYQTYR